MASKWQIHPQPLTRESRNEDKRITEIRRREEAQLADVLANGWEPFAANKEGVDTYMIWFRKPAD